MHWAGAEVGRPGAGLRLGVHLFPTLSIQYLARAQSVLGPQHPLWKVTGRRGGAAREPGRCPAEAVACGGPGKQERSGSVEISLASG